MAKIMCIAAYLFMTIVCFFLLIDAGGWQLWLKFYGSMFAAAFMWQLGKLCK